MFEEIYKEAYEKLNNDIRILVGKLWLDKAGKSRAYLNGLTEACEAFLRLASDSSGDLIIALDRESEKVAAYYEVERAADDSSHEQQ